MKHSAAEKRRQEIAAAVAAGEPLPIVAARFGVSLSLVKAASRRGKMRVGRQVDLLGVVAALCSSPDKFGAIAIRFNCSRQYVSQVYHRCLAAGVPVILRRNSD